MIRLADRAREASPVRTFVLALTVAVTAACSEPALPEAAPQSDAAEDVLTDDVLDPTRDELVTAIATLRETVVVARDELDAAAAAERDTTARTSVSAALAALLDGAGSSASPGIFPSVTFERSGEGGEQDDLLTTTLALAREAGGGLGRATVETLRDPVAGDLGAWERDAQGMVASAEAAVAGARDADMVTDEVMALPADGTRALAWTTLAAATDDPALRATAAERASGHLSVVLVALSLLEDDGGTP